MKKEQEARRAQHEKYLCQMRDEANVEIAMLKSSVVGEEGPSGAASDASFPDDPIEDINCLTPPIRLSQEEREQGSQDFNQFQKMIFKHVGERLKKKPRKYISPFLIPNNCPKVPLAKAQALRIKIASDEKLRE